MPSGKVNPEEVFNDNSFVPIEISISAEFAGAEENVKVVPDIVYADFDMYAPFTKTRVLSSFSGWCVRVKSVSLPSPVKLCCSVPLVL